MTTTPDPADARPELKPCPHPLCGCTSAYVDQVPHFDVETGSSFDRYQVVCEACSCAGPLADDDGEAARLWNTRTALASAPEGEWQPIETAPIYEDDCLVWVYGGHVSEPTMRRSDGGWWRLSEKDGGLRNPPTRWRPVIIPPLPESA